MVLTCFGINLVLPVTSQVGNSADPGTRSLNTLLSDSAKIIGTFLQPEIWQAIQPRGIPIIVACLV